jgi:hypothetical protein
MAAHFFGKREDRLSALAEATDLHAPVDALIRGIYTKQMAWTARRTAMQEKMRCAHATVKTDPYASAALHRLLSSILTRTEWSGIELVIPSLGPRPGNTVLDGLLMLALRHGHWRAAPERWEPETGSSRQQFGAFVRHLFPGYHVPAFLDAAWFEGFTPHGEAHRDWFLHLRKGHNIRTAELPVPLTSRAAHHFLEAPPDSSIVGALRWGQTLALGGGSALAQAVAESRLAEVQSDEPFWHTVLQFVVQAPDLTPAQVGPLLDYIHCRRFGESSDGSDAPEPDFAMKGRTLPALEKRLAEWHALLANEAKRTGVSWPPSGIAPFSLTERDPYGATNDWSVVELLTHRILREEGSDMHNCVRTYVTACQRGTTSIWSLRVRGSHHTRAHRLLTIEVNNARRAIVQVRARCNRLLSYQLHVPRMKAAEEMLRRWAVESHLTIACTL